MSRSCIAFNEWVRCRSATMMSPTDSATANPPPELRDVARDPHAGTSKQVMIDCAVLDYTLPLGVVVRFRTDHPLINRIEPNLLRLCRARRRQLGAVPPFGSATSSRNQCEPIFYICPATSHSKSTVNACWPGWSHPDHAARSSTPDMERGPQMTYFSSVECSIAEPERRLRARYLRPAGSPEPALLRRTSPRPDLFTTAHTGAKMP